MAITSFPATYQISGKEMANLLNESPLKGKEGNEVIWSLDAVQVWQEWFAERHGELTGLRHRSNPNDPPDLDLIFECGHLGLEHTVLQPHPLGYAEAIAKKVNPAGGRLLPSISEKWTRDELEKLAVPLVSETSWVNVGDEHRAAFEALADTLQRKMKNPASQVICFTDRTTIAEATTEWLASDLYRLANSKDFEDFGDRTVIFHHRDNSLQFFSALVQRGEPLLAKRDRQPVVPRSAFSFT